jgi:hypothetical protein
MVGVRKLRRSRTPNQFTAAISHEGSFVARGEAGASSMNAQLIYADKRGSLCAVNQGSNERDHKDGLQVMIRDVALGAELAAATKYRADYVALRANAQFTVPEDQLSNPSPRRFRSGCHVGCLRSRTCRALKLLW